MRLFRSNLRRLSRRPATLVTYLLLSGLMLLIMLALAAAAMAGSDARSAMASRLILTFPGALRLTLTMVVAVGGLISLTYGAAIAGAEWSWGTLKTAVARGEARSGYVLAGIAGAIVMVWAGALVAYLAGIAGALAAASAAHVANPTLVDAQTAGDLPGLAGRAALALAMDTSIGYAVATVARSQLAGIGAGIGLYIGEGIIGAFAPQVVRWAPFAASSAMLAGSSPEGTGSAAALAGPGLDTGTAAAVVVAWLLLSAAFAALWTERAEIGG